MTQAIDLGKIGIWSGDLRYGAPEFARAAAAELEQLGYGAIWMPGGVGGDILAAMSRTLAATAHIAVCSGIVNIWKHEPSELGAWWRGLEPAHQARALLGVGSSHGPLVGEAYKAPLATMRAYLDKLDGEAIPREHVCIGALGPKMLALARDRTAGAHPYFTTPAHTARARAILGPGPLLAPEQKVILERDAAKARELARSVAGYYRSLPNYVNNWRALGFSEDEIAAMSDRFIDGLFAWGGGEEIKARIDAHYAAGADHVCLQVVGVDADGARRAWRELAPLLT